MLRGLDKIEAASQTIANLGNGDWIKRVSIQDGDIALIRFVTDADDLIGAKFHDVKKLLPSGKEIKVPTYCTLADTGACVNCSVGTPAYNTVNLWCYCYYILHKAQNPKIQAGSSDGIWQQVKQGKLSFYREEVNAFRWFRIKYGYQNRYKELFIKFSEKYSTLIDRDYAWSIKVEKGPKQTIVNYDLDDKKEAPISKEIAKEAKKLPDLGDVVSGKVVKFKNGDEEKSVEAEEVDGKDNGADSKDEDGLF